MSMSIKGYPEGNINITILLNTLLYTYLINHFMLTRQSGRKQKYVWKNINFLKRRDIWCIYRYAHFNIKLLLWVMLRTSVSTVQLGFTRYCHRFNFHNCILCHRNKMIPRVYGCSNFFVFVDNQLVSLHYSLPLWTAVCICIILARFRSAISKQKPFEFYRLDDKKKDISPPKMA